MENGGYLFAAFAIVWAMLFAYVFFLAIKQKQLQREVNSLRQRLREKQDI